MEARNLDQRTFKITHGFGVVMIPAAQGGEEPIPGLSRASCRRRTMVSKLTSPPFTWPGGFRPGHRPNGSGEMGYPSATPLPNTNYRYRRRAHFEHVPQIDFFHLFRRERYLLHHQNQQRQPPAFRRNIVERIKTITPFFTLDKDPYIVVTPKGLFWIQDAYTMSSLYPGRNPTTRALTISAIP